MRHIETASLFALAVIALLALAFTRGIPASQRRESEPSRYGGPP